MRVPCHATRCTTAMQTLKEPDCAARVRGFATQHRTAQEVVWFGALNWSRPLLNSIGLKKDNCDAALMRLRQQRLNPFQEQNLWQC